MKVLRFDNNVQSSDQLNLTVRRGVKWCGVTEARVIGNNSDEPSFVVAQIEETKVIKFSDLTDSDLSCEHDPECQTVSGLSAVMHQVYDNFDRREIVTLVYYRIGG